MSVSIWYEVTTYSNQVRAVNVVKETAKMIVIVRPETKWSRESESSTLKKSRYSQFYPSFKEAREALRDRLVKKIADLRSSITVNEECLKNLDA
jgi:hypothetical protein